MITPPFFYMNQKSPPDRIKTAQGPALILLRPGVSLPKKKQVVDTGKKKHALPPKIVRTCPFVVVFGTRFFNLKSVSVDQDFSSLQANVLIQTKPASKKIAPDLFGASWRTSIFLFRPRPKRRKQRCCHHGSLSSWMVNLRPPKVPPLRNQGLIRPY